MTTTPQWRPVVVGTSVVDAKAYGVKADGATDDYAALTTAIAALTALGGGILRLPPGTILLNAPQTQGGVEIPVGMPIEIVGAGKDATMIKLTRNVPRAFDFYYHADGQNYRNVTLKGFTVDANNIDGTAIAAAQAATGGVTLTAGQWVTVPIPTPTAFPDRVGLCYFASGTGTAVGKWFACRLSGGNLQVRNDTGGSLTVVSGDTVQGAAYDHVVLGNFIAKASVARYNMTFDHVTLDSVKVKNVPTRPGAALNSNTHTRREILNITLRKNPANLPGAPLTATNITVKNCEGYGGDVGWYVTGQAGTFIDEVWYLDSYHDTLVTPTNQSSSLNFMIGQDAWVGRCGIKRCTGKNSWDVAYEVDQPWECLMEDNYWEDSWTGAYSTSFQPPARTSAGAPTATINNGGALSSGATSMPISALPTGVAKAGLLMVESELMWYQADTAGTTLTVQRGYNSTTAAAHPDGKTVTFVQFQQARGVIDYRTRVRRRNLTSGTDGNGSKPGRGIQQQANIGLPLPKLKIRDFAYESTVASDTTNGEGLYWQGWNPSVDVEGSFTHHGISHPTSESFNSSMIDWSATTLTAYGASSSTNAPPQFVRLRGGISLSGAYEPTSPYPRQVAIAVGTGWQKLDVDMDIEQAMLNNGLVSLTGMEIQANAGSLNAYIAEGSTIKLKHRTPRPLTDTPITLDVGTPSQVVFKGPVDVELDCEEMVFNSFGTQAKYFPFRIGVGNETFLRVHKVAHPLFIANSFPRRRVQGPPVPVTGAYTATFRDEYVPCDPTGGAFAVTLPATAGGGPTSPKVGRGHRITIKNETSSTNAITITPPGAETVDGAATLVLNTAYGKATLVSTGAGWAVV